VRLQCFPLACTTDSCDPREVKVNGHVRLCVVLGLCWLGLSSSGGDLAAVRSHLPKLPPPVATERPCWAFVFGTNAECSVWAVLDKSGKESPVFDVLYLDVNGDGDLTQPGERFAANENVVDAKKGTNAVFMIGRFIEPGTHREHTELKISWRPNRVSYRMKWLGEKVCMGPYGSEPDQCIGCGSSPQSAPVLVPGHDRPFQFQHWMSAILRRDGENDFRVFMGNIGDGLGAFCAVTDQFLPAGEYVVATLIYRDKSGASSKSAMI